MYKDLKEVIETLENLKRLGHLKNFEYNIITDYIKNINQVLDQTFSDYFSLKEDYIKLEEQNKVYKKILDKYLSEDLDVVFKDEK